MDRAKTAAIRSAAIATAVLALLVTGSGTPALGHQQPAPAAASRTTADTPTDRDSAGISCVTRTWCLIGTINFTPAGETSTMARWNGTSFERFPAPAVVADATYLSDVDCYAADACMAVRYANHHVGAGSAGPGAYFWNGSTWTATFDGEGASCSYSDPSCVFLKKVQCISRSLCFASGSLYVNGSIHHDRPYMARWTPATGWESLGLDGVGGGVVQGFDCPTARRCVAVGGNPPGNLDSRAWMWSGSTWRTFKLKGTANLTDVSCSSASFCVTVTNRTSYVWNGRSWRFKEIPRPRRASLHPVDVFPVACPRAGRCISAGGAGTHGIAYRYQHGRWHRFYVNPARMSAFVELTCVSMRYCLATGWTTDPSRTRVQSYNGSTWRTLPQLPY